MPSYKETRDRLFTPPWEHQCGQEKEAVSIVQTAGYWVTSVHFYFHGSSKVKSSFILMGRVGVEVYFPFYFLVTVLLKSVPKFDQINLTSVPITHLYKFPYHGQLVNIQ